MNNVREKARFLVAIIVIVVIVHGCNMLEWVPDEDAKVRIEEMFPTNATVTILRDDGNDIMLIHSPGDVTFELSVVYADGLTTRPTARCRKVMFAEMVCRVYLDGHTND